MENGGKGVMELAMTDICCCVHEPPGKLGGILYEGGGRGMLGMFE